MHHVIPDVHHVIPDVHHVIPDVHHVIPDVHHVIHMRLFILMRTNFHRNFFSMWRLDIILIYYSFYCVNINAVKNILMGWIKTLL